MKPSYGIRLGASNDPSVPASALRKSCSVTRRCHGVRAEDAFARSGARALAKAERYRLLNEPGEAESICLDALEVEPDNQEALITLLLALTDQFDDDATVLDAGVETVAERIRGDYERAYYTGHRLGAARQSAPQARRARLRPAAPTSGCARR